MIKLTDDLCIKKLEPDSTDDIWLIESLDRDELISGPNGYLWSLKHDKVFKNLSYLEHNEIYDSQFSIYFHNKPIGYLNISKIYQMMEKSNVVISYALLEEARGQGFMQKVLSSICDKILTDEVNYIDEVIGVIDINNIQSQKVAINSGFVDDGLSEQEHIDAGYIKYFKTKKMVKRR